MRRLTWIVPFALLASLTVVPGVGTLAPVLDSIAWAQYPATEEAPAEEPAATPEDDAVGQQAAQLEAELGKLRDTTPEAGELMLQLIDLYHADGRVFGLIRNGEKFVNNHPLHPRHQEAMARLIDGLRVVSRNKDVVANIRQFLVRYPDADECPALEIVLAESLVELADRQGAGAAYETVWRRQPTSDLGRQAGIDAVSNYVAANTTEGFAAAATLAEAMLDSYPPGEFATQVGWQAVSNWQRINEWAKSNAAAAKLLKKGGPAAQDGLKQLHVMMGDNYSRLGQRANAVASYQQARSLEDSAFLHRAILTEMHNGAFKAAEMEPLVNEYVQKYPDREDRFAMRSHLAVALLRDGEKARGLAVLAELLPHDAITNSNASLFARENGVEPDQLARTEAVLLDALKSNQKHAYYLRWVLGLEHYRDRVKDIGKARLTVRDLVLLSPTNDSYTQQAISWLLTTAPDDNEFQADFTRLLEVRQKHLHWAGHRQFLGQWVQSASADMTLMPRAAWARPKLDEADAQPIAKDWLAVENPNAAIADAARTKLGAADNLPNLSDEQARLVLGQLAFNLYHYYPADQRPRSATVYGVLAKRFPKDYPAAQMYLQAAIAYGTPEVAREAALHLLELEAIDGVDNTITYYYLAQAADRSQDVDLLRRVLAWITATQQRLGYTNLTYADSIGDILDKHGLKDEALAYWRRAMEADYNAYYSRSCAGRLLTRIEDPAARIAELQTLVARPGDFHGYYAMMLADEYLKLKDLDNFEKVLRASQAVQAERPFRNWGIEEYPPHTWIDQYRANKEINDADKRRVFAVVRDLEIGRPSATAHLALLELPPEKELTPIERLLEFQFATRIALDDATSWDRLFGYAQAAMTRRDYTAVAALVSGMLANIPNIDVPRQQAGRDMVAQSYARMGTVGLSIDEKSPIAPLLQAALYLRLGDTRLALDSYTANRQLFDEHRYELPVDLILFVCDSHIAAGGDENHERAEDILRGWLVKFSEAMDLDDSTKASVQLMLAKNYYKAQRYDVARGEYTTVMNRYAATPEAVEAEFGIGESFMAQKVYDQAEAVFEKLSGSKERDVVIRAEFLRGVLANRRGDRDEARDIFRAVLEMVPNIELANQALYNLAEVYGAEQRYMDQLELLRTVGRLGRASKRWHAPGADLSIVVQDSDLGVSRGHAKIPVLVTTNPGGDQETLYLYSGGAGKGLFRADLPTRLGEATAGDGILQLTGRDTIFCDYPEQFKAEFKSVPLSDAEIRIASNGKLDVASTKIIDKEKESFSDRLAREAREEAERDRPIAFSRPANQIKPGNPVYLRVVDADRDLTNEPDTITVKLSATSGDQVQVTLLETAPHSGIFEGSAPTGELPAGALASDTAIDHSPLMAIDQDPASYWLSEPDGATPKFLSVDMKDLRLVDHATFQSPDAQNQAPVRGLLQGSHDGRFWYRLASVPPQPPVEAVAGDDAQMTQRVYAGYFLNLTDWQQVVDLSKNETPVEETPVDQLTFLRTPDAEDANQAYGVLWHGKFVQPRPGAVRFAIQAARSALVVDGELELPLDNGPRVVDVWLEPGAHDLTIFAATPSAAQQPLAVTRAREDQNQEQILLGPFRSTDFDLTQQGSKPAVPRAPAVVRTDNGVWDFEFDEIELRHLKLVVQEYLGEAVAISHVLIQGEDETHIPTAADVLSLAGNDTLEIAAGDLLTATYTDEFSQTAAGRSQLLTGTLVATYHNARISPISYDFVRERNGQVLTIRKQLIRIDPGERFIIEVIDYDADQTEGQDEVTIEVTVNDGEPVRLTATESEFDGIFTKEVDTSSAPAEGKLTVKPGDRIYCQYVDAQNTFPGHAVSRETVVYVNQPSNGRMRIVETRIVPAPQDARGVPPQVIYLPQPKKAADRKKSVNVAFEAPLTIEVFDRDAAKDSRSMVTVELATTEGSKIEVECVVSDAFSGLYGEDGLRWALEEGRFVGQVILQLGSQHSQSVVPLSANMPRNLVGRAKIPEDQVRAGGETLVTRVLNLTGKDIISATYQDEQRQDKKPVALTSRGRLIANGTLECTDRDYARAVTQLHVGEKMFLRVVDADVDVSDERDTAQVEITTERGDREVIELHETLAHSGVFTGSVLLRPAESPTPGDSPADEPAVDSYFGDTVRLRYIDHAASTETGDLEVLLELPVVVGTDGLVAAFSKVFGDEKLAVETQFHIAESYFELFKSHKKLERQDDLRTDLEAGRRVLREVMEDYPDPKYVPRTAYLLGQFAQELAQWNEAIDSYKLIVRQYPDHGLAVDAQYKLAQCYEEAGDFDNALEAYVTLAATYPKSPLIANVMIRISERFYKEQNYPVAAQVGEKFLERFDGHEWAPRMAFRVGQCYYKDKQYIQAAESFDRFAKVFPDDELCSDSLFWSGESFRMASNNSQAFRRYNRCRWDFPASEAAKYARGRLALPAMLQQFEIEADVEE
jgi:TolA-binding protein